VNRTAAFCVISTLTCAAFANELTGTPFSLVWRGSAGSQPAQAAQWDRRYADPRYPPAAAPAPQIVRLFDLQARREIARAAYDARIGGWMFQMPLSGIDAKPNRCLGLVDMRNMLIPVRRPSHIDNGGGFQHPAWELELSRATELASLRQERSAVDGQMRSADAELARIQVETGLPLGSTAAQCPLPAEPPAPARPAAAVEESNVASISGALCAWRWSIDIGSKVDLGRLFDDAGVTADWRARSSAQAHSEAFGSLRIRLSPQDASLVVDAATKGKTFLEHSDGIRVVRRAHAACRDEVARMASAAREAWGKDIEAAKHFPQRARQACAEKLARAAQLQAGKAAAPALLAALDNRIAQAERPPAVSDPSPLSQNLCQP